VTSLFLRNVQADQGAEDPSARPTRNRPAQGPG
jgi:hypothetical protein